MSVTSGFFNSLNHDRLYDATQMSQIFDGIIRDGVYESIGSCFVVNADGSLYVTVGTGRAWFNHTWIYNDAILPLALTDEYAPEVLTNRYDAVILDIDSSPDVRADSIMIVKGTPSSEIDFRNYVPGTVPESITLINEENHHQYPIAIIERPASQTEIKGSEIHNMVGTDYCPFVTGILEVTSADKFFKEWAAELTEFVSDQESSFASWSAYQKQEFLTWAAASRTDFDNWSVDTKAAFEQWMDDEKADFDAWYANLQIQLSGQVATNLQRQISDLERDKLDVSRYESEIGNTDYSQLGSTITEALMNSGGSRVQVNLEKKDGVSITNILCTISQGDYSLSADMSAINTIEFSGFRELTPITVTVNFKMDGQSTFVTKDIEVSCYKKYEVSFKLGGGSIWDGWLEAGGIEKEFDGIDDIMADSQAVNILFSNHGSVDWIVAYCENDPTAFDYFKDNETARKAIAKYDYTWEKIGEISGARRYLLAQSDWERYLKDKVPKMTSNTEPEGNVIYTSIFSQSTRPWCIFNDDIPVLNADANAWSGDHTINDGIGYKFPTPINVSRIGYINRKYDTTIWGVSTFKIQYSDNGIDWNDASPVLTSKYDTNMEYVDVEYSGYHIYWRMFVLSRRYDAGQSSGSYNVSVSKLNFYGRSLIGVPTMTSNTTPEGEAFGSDVLNGDTNTYGFFRAFDKNESTSFVTNRTSNGYVGYDFKYPVCIKGAYFKLDTVNPISKRWGNNSIDYFDEEANKWVSAGSFDESLNTGYSLVNESGISAQKWRLYGIKQSMDQQIAELNFFGQDLTDPHLKYSDGLSASTLLQKARWTGTAYSSMDDLLADEKAVRQVFTVHDSSDYFVQNIEADPSMLDPFLLNRFACKWIGLRDYVCDKLLAIDAAAEKLLTNETEFTLSDGTTKKGWEYILKDSVPTMTSNTAPEGEASASSEHADTVLVSKAYAAFDGNVRHWWHANTSQPVTGQYLIYHFVKPIKALKMEFRNAVYANVARVKDFTLQVSNDGKTWKSIGQYTASNVRDMSIPDYNAQCEVGIQTFFDIDADDYYLYYRVNVDSMYGGGMPAISTLNFYGRSLNESVPLMTGNTAPLGEVIFSTPYSSGYAAFQAFDKNNNKSYAGNSSRNVYIGYNFEKRTRIKAIEFAPNMNGNNAMAKNVILQGSNDGFVDEVDTIDRYIFPNTTQSVLNIEKNCSYKAYRLFVEDGYDTTGYIGFVEIQFYGVSYSEEEFGDEGIEMLYDNGVDLANVVPYEYQNASAPNVHKREDYVDMQSAKCGLIYKEINPTLYKMAIGEITPLNALTNTNVVVGLANVTFTQGYAGSSKNIYTNAVSGHKRTLACDISSVSQTTAVVRIGVADTSVLFIAKIHKLMLIKK